MAFLPQCGDPKPVVGPPITIAILMPRPASAGAKTPRQGDAGAGLGDAGQVDAGADKNDGDGTPKFPALEWALENVNKAGGVAGGRQIQFKYFDPASDVIGTAARIVADESIVAAIGPGQSTEMFAIASLFQKAKKPLISYSATSGEILRAYGGGRFVWRTKESDIVQTELMTAFAKKSGAKRLALLTPVDGVGATFFNWFGFFATDAGYASDALAVTPWSSGAECKPLITRVLKKIPDILFAVPSMTSDVSCVVKQWRAWRRLAPTNTTRLVLADTGLDVNALKELAPDSEDVEGFSASPASGNGFQEAFNARTGGSGLPNNAANGYDAVLLLAYGLQRSGGNGGDALDNAMREVVGYRGASVGWDGAGVKAALDGIGAGTKPDISGATGSLTFDSKLFVDPTGTTLARYKCTSGAIRYDEAYDTSTFTTANGALVTPSASALSEDTGSYLPAAARTDLQVVIASFSSGWPNYRHQSDALRQYQLLRARGVPDDKIVLIGANDLAGAQENVAKGTVLNQVSGSNVYANAQYDYTPTVTAMQLLNILQGSASADTPTVLHPTSGTDVYVYLVGHGAETGVSLNATSTAEGLVADTSGAYFLQAAPLREALCAMQAKGIFRRVFLAVEACYAGGLGDAALGGIAAGCSDGGTGTRPLQGVLLMTGANAAEVSYATEYDSTVKAWLADGFSLAFANFAHATPTGTLRDAYQSAYVGVSGSHVSVYNSAAFGRLGDVRISDFFAP
jgi:ABC-type branched-subunit amino acid transport system substrate-binding protein/glycosylphosphatidylinositol transamidase (GPIT) subunit GPI8